MDYLERIERWNAITYRIAMLRRLLSKKEETLDNIRKQCEHEVVVCINRLETLERASTNVHMKCIFCGKETIESTTFKNSEIIDVSEFKEKNKYNAKAKFKIANAMFLRIAERKPEFSAKGIAKIANEHLRVEDEKFQKLIDKK